MYLNKPYSQVRQEVKNGNVGSGRVMATKSGKSFFHSVTGKVGLGAVGAGLGGTTIHSLADNKSSDISGEMGNHFHNAFANTFGLNEDSGGVSVASSSGPMPAVGGVQNSFPPLKELSPVDKIWKKAIKNKN